MKNVRKGTRACILFVMVLGLAEMANALPITFDEFPIGTAVSSQYTAEGVRFLPGDVTCRLPQVTLDNPIWMPTLPFLRPTGEPDYTPFQGDFWMEFVHPVSHVDFLTGSWDQIGAGIIRV